MEIEEYLLPYIFSNITAVGLLLLSICRPRTSKYIFAVIFLAAGVFNFFAVSSSPEIYVEGYGKTAVFSFYKEFIYGPFSRNTELFVRLIACGQMLVGILLMSRKFFFKAGIAGGILFFIAIAPLGIGSAFPCTAIMALSLYFLIRKGSGCCLIDFISPLISRMRSRGDKQNKSGEDQFTESA